MIDPSDAYATICKKITDTLPKFTPPLYDVECVSRTPSASAVIIYCNLQVMLAFIVLPDGREVVTLYLPIS